MPLALAIMRQGKRNIISARVLTAVEELIDSPKECPLPVPVLEFICSMCAALLCPGLLQKERAGHTWRKPRRKSRDSKGSKESAEATFSIMGKVRASITLRHAQTQRRPEAKLRFLKISVWTRVLWTVVHMMRCAARGGAHCVICLSKMWPSKVPPKAWVTSWRR